MEAGIKRSTPDIPKARRSSARRWLGFALGLAVAYGLLLYASALPSLEGRSTSAAILDTEDTRLGRGVASWAEGHPGLTGVYALSDAREAFAARILLARAAERTLDVQYYIWRGDLTGTLLFDELLRAAERGVRVRLLLDDIPTDGLEDALIGLDAHPNLEVRLFNPFVLRRVRTLNFLTDARRLNRRMHNKSFTADSQASIIGGRNVGDEYFGATDGVLFADLDVLALGAVVPEVSHDFDRYWASDAAFPLSLLLEEKPGALEALHEEADALRQSPATAELLRALRESRVIQGLLERTLPLEWKKAQLVSDDPRKVLRVQERDENMLTQLREVLGPPKRSFSLVSPYFVPGERGVGWLTGMARAGTQVRVLTNSLEATDVALVQGGYSKRRLSLLEGGVELFELRRRGAGVGPTSGPWGSSGSSLHAKTFAIDGEKIFVGSFNFDPRSAHLNTEMGFVIESGVLAGRLEALFEDAIPKDSYRVESEGGRVVWREQSEEGAVVHRTEPGTTFWQRAGVFLLSHLPIEWLL